MYYLKKKKKKKKRIRATIIYIPTYFFDLNLCIKIKIKLVSLIRIENAKNCQSHSACLKINLQLYNVLLLSRSLYGNCSRELPVIA